jgi:hypothetical protein
MIDLVESMADATTRKVKWVGGKLSQVSKTRRRSSGGSSSMDASARKALRGHIGGALGGLGGLGGALTRFSSSSMSSSSSSRRIKLESIFIIMEPAAEAHALAMYGLLSAQKKRCATANPTSTEEMELCLERISSATYVILLQTRSVLVHPWPLLATYYANLARVPRVCVVVTESGYDCSTVEGHLTHLKERLDAAALEQMSRVLSAWSPPRTVASLQTKLYNFIPRLTSVVYNPSGTNNESDATVRDIQDSSVIQIRAVSSSAREVETFVRRCSARMRRNTISALIPRHHRVSPEAT